MRSGTDLTRSSTSASLARRHSATPCGSSWRGATISFLYVAAHGEIGKIKAPDGTWLSRTFLRNTFVEVNRRKRRLKGVLFGSCQFGD